MILLIVQNGSIEVLRDINEIKERRTQSRTLIEPFRTGSDSGLGEIELNLVDIKLLPEDPYDLARR